MSRCIRIALATCPVLFVLTSTAWAATGGAAHSSAEGLKILGIAVLNLVILAGVLWRFGRAPIAAFVFQRSERIRRELESSQAQLAAAEAEIAALQRRLADLERESEQLVDLARRQASGERERMEARARETADRIRREAERIADVEVQRARQTLRAEAASLATSLAADLLRERLGPDDDARLIQEFSAQLEETTH